MEHDFIVINSEDKIGRKENYFWINCKASPIVILFPDNSNFYFKHKFRIVKNRNK
jgi:hypothetical protein